MPSVSSNGLVAMNDAAKDLLFRIHCERGDMAYSSDGKIRPLKECDINDVKLVAGLWRIQNKFEYPVQIVRDKEFVLLEKTNRTEKNMFEFYRARMVGKNCYGRFLISGVEQIVAKYKTDKQTYWAYGDSIEHARAFLGIRLFDEYAPLIHSVACKDKLSQK